MSKTTIIGDCETFPNCFQFCAEFVDVPLKLAFEISDRRDDSRSLYEFFCWVAKSGLRIAGFNWNRFDGPIIHLFMRMGGKITARSLYDKAQAIITAQDDDEGNRWAHSVKPTDRDFEWLDLYRIWHFDNKAKSTSLKILEFNMKMGNISDLPFPVGTVLDHSQMQVLMNYCQHDVSATKQFYSHSLPMIKFREELCVKYPGREWTAFNDTKIGKEYFTMQLEASGVQCFEYGANGRQPRQTRRASIALKDAILPWIKFENPEFQRVLDWLRQQTITETKGVFTDLTASINGFTFVFGLGGIHGSVESEVIESDGEHVIVDLDVTSYYPNLAIANGFYPAHLGKEFVSIYKYLFEQRKSYPKKSAESAMLKLALNGVYGDSNNPFSVFYDPLFTMRITLGGQLLLCLLAEGLMKIDKLRVISCNTDGITVYLRRDQEPVLVDMCDRWSKQTGLTLESAKYRIMAIADVNSYIAEYENEI